MANSLKLSFAGVSVSDPYKSQLKLKFFGVNIDTQKQSALKFWGVAADVNNNPDMIFVQII